MGPTLAVLLLLQVGQPGPAQISGRAGPTLDQAQAALLRAQVAQRSRSFRVRPVAGGSTLVFAPPDRYSVDHDDPRRPDIVRIGADLWTNTGAGWKRDPDLAARLTDIHAALGPQHVDDWAFDLAGVSLMTREKRGGLDTEVFEYVARPVGGDERHYATVKAWVASSTGLPVAYRAETLQGRSEWLVEYEGVPAVAPPPGEEAEDVGRPVMPGNIPPLRLAEATGVAADPLPPHPAVVVRSATNLQLGPDRFDDPARLAAALGPTPEILLFADGALPWSTVEPVLDAVRARGVKVARLVVRRLSVPRLATQPFRLDVPFAPDGERQVDVVDDAFVFGGWMNARRVEQDALAPAVARSAKTGRGPLLARRESEAATVKDMAALGAAVTASGGSIAIITPAMMPAPPPPPPPPPPPVPRPSR